MFNKKYMLDMIVPVQVWENISANWDVHAYAIHEYEALRDLLLDSYSCYFWYQIRFTVIILMFMEKTDCLNIYLVVSKDRRLHNTDTKNTRAHMHEGNVMSQFTRQMNPLWTQLQSFLSTNVVNYGLKWHD